MTANFRRPWKWKVAAVGSLAVLAAPAAALAFFPPFYHYPYPVPVQTTPVTPPVVNSPPPAVPPPPPPIVAPKGNPDPIPSPPPPVVTPPVSGAPEPGTLLTGLIGLALVGGRALRRQLGASRAGS